MVAGQKWLSETEVDIQAAPVMFSWREF